MAKKSYWDETYYPQPTEQELRRNAAETAQKASKKGKLLNPVVLSGRKIAKSWWGQAWCENLERYADFDTRLSRGQRYVRSGAGGLFPTPREISFSCSCPDWAMMCKHVAAALYGVGAQRWRICLGFYELNGVHISVLI